MSVNQTRLELQIDVFEKTNQRALALPDLTPPQLIDAILKEFRELEYLGDAPADYQLRKVQDRSPLADDHPLGEQLQPGERLMVIENGVPLPPNTQPPIQPVYLREQSMGKVYKLHWQPAIIGRPDRNQANPEPVAINLEGYKTGLRVSRRQAKITEENGRYFIESMSDNPTIIKRDNGATLPVAPEKQPLQNGDIIYLERSNIALKFIVRPRKPQPKEK